MTEPGSHLATEPNLGDRVVEAESGGRAPQGAASYALFVVPILWSCFQLWYASPLPFAFNFVLLNDTEARSIHLGFAVFLAFVAFPAFKRSPRHRVPLQDWGFALLGAGAAAYLYLLYEDLAQRAGLPTTPDLIVGVAGLTLLLEATRRALGPALVVVALVFLGYAFAGPYMPDIVAHKGVSLSKAVSHYWLSTEGVFGIALGVSTNFVFLFVLFGALMERAGAGTYFVQVAYALLGHLRGGPAKAAVVASGMNGMVSGSSIANVVYTGTFTIPLTKRVGFPSEKAGAVEVASSTNGQLTPPLMGAAAFLMAEYVGIPYVEVIQHAILPALIAYAALFYIVHLEALKANMRPMGRREPRVRRFTTISAGLTLIAVTIAGMYLGLDLIKDLMNAAPGIPVGIAVIIYLAALTYATGGSAKPVADDEKPPEIGPTFRSGLHYLVPVGRR